MEMNPTLRKSLLVSGIYTAVLTCCFLFFFRTTQSASGLFIALPYFVVLYFLLFSLGKPQVSDWLREKMKGDIRVIVLFPLLLVFLYYSYVGLHNQNPFEGLLLLIPHLLLFPVALLAARRTANDSVDWLDFAVFFIFFFPVTLINAKPAGNLPYEGGGFDSVYRISVMLSAVFAFITVRHIRDVGFYPMFRWKSLFTVLWVWLAFYGAVAFFGWTIDFIRLKQDGHINIVINAALVKSFITVFLHTALFEELVFRGLFQQMLARRIGQAGSWKTFWSWGMMILTVLALLTGYSLSGSMQWFPALVTLVLGGVAWVLEHRKVSSVGVYTSLAITSVFFGLVHAHSGSVVFVGLAAIGGWVYGYTFIKTKNVFYAALLHALVNTTPLLFGLELAK